MIKGILRSDIQAYHSEEHKGEVNGLGLEILLMEENCCTGEANKNASATYHRDDTDHRLWLGECIKINKVGCTEEHTHTDNTPIPMEWGNLLAFGPPQYH